MLNHDVCNQLAAQVPLRGGYIYEGSAGRPRRGRPICGGTAGIRCGHLLPLKAWKLLNMHNKNKNSYKLCHDTAALRQKFPVTETYFSTIQIIIKRAKVYTPTIQVIIKTAKVYSQTAQIIIKMAKIYFQTAQIYVKTTETYFSTTQKTSQRPRNVTRPLRKRPGRINTKESGQCACVYTYPM